MQPHPQKKLAQAHRIEGSLILYRSAARSQRKAEKSRVRAEPWWSMVLEVPLFLRTLLRLVFVCLHRHRSPPITLRTPSPSNLPGYPSESGRGMYVTCLDCGQKFAYNHKSRRLVDFWGIHNPEALAELRRRVDGFVSPLRSLAARVGRLNLRIPINEFVRSLHRLAILTKSPWTKSQRSIASKWVPR
jgi:hypothetical protein